MKPFNVMFEESNTNEILYNGQIVRSLIRYENLTSVHLKIYGVRTNSPHTQAIDFHFPKGFKGKVFINDHECKVPKNAFPQIILWEDDMPEEVFVDIYFRPGDRVSICNGADKLSKEKFGWPRICSTWLYGSALILEPVGEGEYLVKCNDFDNDDDFDDLIFNMKVEVRKCETRFVQEKESIG